MSGPVEVSEVERLRMALHEEEDRCARLTALLEQARDDVDKVRRDRDSAIMERATCQRRADRDRLTIGALTQAAADALTDVQRARIVAQQASAAVERLQVQADRARRDALALRVGAIVGVAGAAPNHHGHGVVLHIDSEPARVMVWWIHPDRPRDTLAHPGWSTPEGLRVIG